MTDAASTKTPRAWDGLACAAIALAAYVLLGQESFYHTDGIAILIE